MKKALLTIGVALCNFMGYAQSLTINNNTSVAWKIRAQASAMPNSCNGCYISQVYSITPNAQTVFQDFNDMAWYPTGFAPSPILGADVWDRISIENPCAPPPTFTCGPGTLGLDGMSVNPGLTTFSTLCDVSAVMLSGGCGPVKAVATLQVNGQDLVIDIN